MEVIVEVEAIRKRKVQIKTHIVKLRLKQDLGLNGYLKKPQVLGGWGSKFSYIESLGLEASYIT